MAINYNFIENEEGWRDRPYNDNGALAVGYGWRKVLPNGEPITENTVITPEQKQAWSQQYFNSYADKAAKALGDKWNNLNDAQQTALASIAYNTGGGDIASSPIVKKLLAGQTPTQADFASYKVTSGGKFNSAIAKRRLNEYQLFTGQKPLPEGETGNVQAGNIQGSQGENTVGNNQPSSQNTADNSQGMSYNQPVQPMNTQNNTPALEVPSLRPSQQADMSSYAPKEQNITPADYTGLDFTQLLQELKNQNTAPAQNTEE